MLLSCKCLNFVASSSSSPPIQQQQQQQQQQRLSRANSISISAAVATADANAATIQQQQHHHEKDCSMSSSSSNSMIVADTVTSNNGNTIAASLMHAFLNKFPRRFVFYSQCMDFFKQAIGPIPEFTINAVNQRDLIFSLTLDLTQCNETWQISVCINCNTALCAKRLQSNLGGGAAAAQYLINSALLTSNDALQQRRADKSYSETFELLIMDHPHLLELESEQQMQFRGRATSVSSNSNSSNANGMLIGSMVSSNMQQQQQQQQMDSKLTRMRQLQQHLQQRLQREIVETDERIQRYTEQQFALLKSYREKSEQEFELLMRLIQQVPEQQSIEWLDRQPPALEVSTNAVNYTSRRRNTISSRKDLNAATAAAASNTTATKITSSNSNSSHQHVLTFPTVITATATAAAAAATSAIFNAATVDNSASNGNISSSNNAMLNRKMSNFDTPPATPEATPMSVGNSPTFKQQQQTVTVAATAAQPALLSLNRNNNGIQQQSFQQQFPTPTQETAADDFLFDLEGVDAFMPATTQHYQSPYQQQQQQHQQQQQQQQRQQQHNHSNHMSDLDESDDDAEEAEDALDMDGSMAIPMSSSRHVHSVANAELLNFAKSVPIEIANSPRMLARNFNAKAAADELDNNVDIAASIKALAKSVHGEAVFGDLPRPRLRSQI